MIDYYEPRLDLTLLGCGFLGTYHLGAIYLLSQVWPQKPYNRICGASCGGLLGALVLVGTKLDQALRDALDIIRQLRRALARTRPGRWRTASIGELVERKLDQILPANAHELCSHKLGISVTRLWGFENEIVSHFASRRELIDAVLAGSFIPLWSGCLRPPRLRGRPCIDGAYSNNSPKFAPQAHDGDGDGDQRPQARQVLVSPFSCDVHVSPQGERHLFRARVLGTLYLANWNNLIRTACAMFPCALYKYRLHMIQGHHDMKDFLLRSNLIQCRDCWPSSAATATQNSVILKPSKRACLACLRLLERVDSLRLPAKTLKIFDDQ